MCARLDLNRGPLPYKGSALTTELRARLLLESIPLFIIISSVAKSNFNC